MDVFCCPITGRLMRDPVITRWGNSFERSAILRAVKNSGLDPVARKPIRDLRPGWEIWENASLRRAIVSKYGQLPPMPGDASPIEPDCDPPPPWKEMDDDDPT